jgi:nucleotide-binding universal stress UspA family protein
MNKHILVLFEGWSVADEAVRYAHALAQRMRGKLSLLLLLSSHEQLSDAELLEARGEELLREQVEGVDDQSVEIERFVRIGDPWSEFCKFVATAGRFHMVVWASEAGLTNGRPVASHWASRIHGELGCPVVTAHRRSR